jgi:hypothetical protein
VRPRALSLRDLHQRVLRIEICVNPRLSALPKKARRDEPDVGQKLFTRHMEINLT